MNISAGAAIIGASGWQLRVAACMTRRDYLRTDRESTETCPMANVLLVAYLLIVLALIAVILLQRSEGGGLGMGGDAGGLMTVRGSANLLTRTTAILAALFFATAIGLTILSELDRGTDSILDQATEHRTAPQPTTVLDALNAAAGRATLSAAGRTPTRRPRPRSRSGGRHPRPRRLPTSTAAPRRDGADPAAAPPTPEQRRHN